jgi:hypothetical protein
MKKTIIAVVISGTTALGLALSSSIAFAQSSDATPTPSSTSSDSSSQQSTTGQLTQDVKQGWNKTKEKAADVKNDIANKYDEEKAKHDDNASNTNTSNNNSNSSANTNNETNNTQTAQAKPEHKYVRKTHYKHHNYRVHHDINWSADQNMARTGYEAPPRGWNGLGRPEVIPKGDNPKWYNVNYGYTTDEMNDNKWHHHHHHHKWHHQHDSDDMNNNNNNSQ